MNLKKDSLLNLRTTVFHFTCYGESDKSTKLLLRDREVNRLAADVCKERVIRIAFNQYPPWFELDVVNNYTFIDHGWADDDIFTSFFKNYKLTPDWHDCNQVWGTIDEETGGWSREGSLGEVSKNGFRFVVHIQREISRI